MLNAVNQNMERSERRSRSNFEVDKSIRVAIERYKNIKQIMWRITNMHMALIIIKYIY